MAYDSCSSCGRHVKRSDEICPFCKAVRVAPTARITQCAARPPSGIVRGQWLALGSAVLSAVILGGCNDGDNAGADASSREAGPSKEAPTGEDGTTAEADTRRGTRDEGDGPDEMDSADAAPVATGADDAASVALGDDAAPGSWLTPGEGPKPCWSQQDPTKTCDRATQYCYAHGSEPTVCGPFATTCTPYRGVGDACVGSDFYWDAAACDGGIRRCACLNMTCQEGTCFDDDAGGITLSCGPCYGAPPARPPRLVS